MTAWNNQLRDEIIGPERVSLEYVERLRREIEREEAKAKGNVSTGHSACMLAEAAENSILAAVLIDIRERLIRIEGAQ